MKLVNLTPHALVVRLNDGTERRIEPSGTIARVATTAREVGTVNGIPVVETTYGDIEGLPAPEDGTVYIVSSLVLAAARASGRADVLAPDTSPESAIRDDAGRIVAVRRFTR